MLYEFRYEELQLLSRILASDSIYTRVYLCNNEDLTLEGSNTTITTNLDVISLQPSKAR